MIVRELYHGTTGDNILQIIRQGALKPNLEGKLFFSESRYDSVLMHGADTKRKLTFAVKLLATIPPEAALQRAATQGVAGTLIITTQVPLRVSVLELYVREPRGTTTRIIKGQAEISKFLALCVGNS